MKRMIALVGLLLVSATAAAQVTIREGETATVFCTPPPVDCVVSEWSEWGGAEWLPATCPAEGQQTRQETRTRSILTEPAYGGTACPGLAESRLATRACTPPPPPPPPAATLFRDQFNYVVNWNDTAETKRARFGAAGWGIKDETTRPGGARGWLSTASSIPGYAGPHPTPRFLRFEARPSLGIPTGQNQTDTYLTRGTPGPINCTTCALPGRVWFQFWAYVNDFGTERSHFAGRNKLIYPSDDGTASGDGTQNAFMLHVRPSNQAGVSQPYGPNFNLVAHMEGAQITSTAPEGGGRLGHNLTAGGFQPANGWYLHKVFVDHSQANGVYQTWIRPMGGTWRQTADWRTGVTPGFTWRPHPSHYNGHSLFKLFTTFGTAQAGDSTNYDVYLYLADFAIATSEAGLPTYSGF